MHIEQLKAVRYDPLTKFSKTCTKQEAIIHDLETFLEEAKSKAKGAEELQRQQQHTIDQM